MTPRVVSVDPQHPDPAALREAGAAIRGGELVAFPTETVYGLGANALDPAAVQRIYDAKGRPAYNPLIVHVPGAADARDLVSAWPDAAAVLAERFWPGPLTLVLPKRPVVPDVVTAGLPAVAVRVPAHPVALALLAAAERPIAAPSANRFTAVSPTRAEHVVKGLGDRVALVLDGGPSTVGIESTVVDLSRGEPRLLRPGMVTRAELEAAIGPVGSAPTPRGTEPRLSPGLGERHYAPRAEVWLCTAGEGAALVREAPPGTVVGALLFEGTDWPVQHPVVMPRDPAGYAHRLYGALHLLDELGCAVVLVERVPGTDAWLGLRDRLTRATVGRPD